MAGNLYKIVEDNNFLEFVTTNKKLTSTIHVLIKNVLSSSDNSEQYFSQILKNMLMTILNFVFVQKINIMMVMLIIIMDIILATGKVK